MWKCKLSIIFLIGNKASIFVYMDMKYHTRSSSSHGTVIINIGQPFKFSVCNSTPIAHLSKHYEDPPWHSGRNWTNILIWFNANNVFVHYGTIILWSCHNELRLCCYLAEICKIVLIVLITALHVSNVLAEWDLVTKQIYSSGSNVNN